MNGVRTIPISSRRHVIVDERDYEWLSQHRWSFCRSTGKDGYAVRIGLVNGERVKISMHREVFLRHSGIDKDELEFVDHRNTNKLDNRFENLRNASKVDNGGNRGANKNNKSGFKGVDIHDKKRGVWRAQIAYKGKKINLGYYATPEEAALAYNNAAVEYFGEFANLNNVSITSCTRLSSSKNAKGYEFKGISFHKRLKKWAAYTKLPSGKRKHIGYFKSELEARQAYDSFMSGLNQERQAS